MAFFRKRTGLRKKAIRRKRRAPRKLAVPRAIKTFVRKAIGRNEETKFATNSYTLTAFNAGISSAGDFITVLPQVPQGVGQNLRIGARIEPVKLVIRGYVIYKNDAYLQCQLC